MQSPKSFLEYQNPVTLRVSRMIACYLANLLFYHEDGASGFISQRHRRDKELSFLPKPHSLVPYKVAVELLRNVVTS
jgi:hypothetical protein